MSDIEIGDRYIYVASSGKRIAYRVTEDNVTAKRQVKPGPRVRLIADEPGHLDAVLWPDDLCAPFWERES